MRSKTRCASEETLTAPICSADAAVAWRRPHGHKAQEGHFALAAGLVFGEN